MLDYKLINYKPTIKKDNNQYIDLLAQTFNEKADASFYPVVVNKYYVARPDLISLTMYGNDQYADIICKINGISNPFELNENMVLLVPNIEYINDCVINNQHSSALVENPKKDTIQVLDKNNMQKHVNDLRSPNQQVIGDSNYIIDKSLGIVFY